MCKEEIYEIIKKCLTNNIFFKDMTKIYGYEQYTEATWVQIPVKNNCIHYEIVTITDGEDVKVGYGLHFELKDEEDNIEYYDKIYNKFKSKLLSGEFSGQLYKKPNSKKVWIHFNYEEIDKDNFENQVDDCIVYLIKLYNLTYDYLIELMENKVELYKSLYPKGTRVVVISMGADPRPIESGTKGTVDYVDDIGTVHCTFDNGRQLGLVPSTDVFRRVW